MQLMDPLPVDLTDAMDGYDGPIYFDFAHTNERGARLVAQAMWARTLRDQVAALQSATHG